jgi:hypothetical protein
MPDLQRPAHLPQGNLHTIRDRPHLVGRSRVGGDPFRIEVDARRQAGEHVADVDDRLDVIELDELAAIYGRTIEWFIPPRGR